MTLPRFDALFAIVQDRDIGLFTRILKTLTEYIVETFKSTAAWGLGAAH